MATAGLGCGGSAAAVAGDVTEPALRAFDSTRGAAAGADEDFVGAGEVAAGFSAGRETVPR
jgi:hypothetical protein